MKGYPKWFSSKLITTVFSLLFLTGLFLIPTTLLRMEVESPISLSGASRISMTAMHSFLSYLMIALIGALTTHHFRIGWKLQRKKITGLSAFFLFVLLALSGIAIYYIGDQDLSLVASFAHLVLGLVLPIIFILHLFFSYGQKNIK